MAAIKETTTVEVRGCYRLNNNYYWFSADEMTNVVCSSPMVLIDLGTAILVGDNICRVSSLDTTDDYHLIVGGFRLTSGEFFKFRKAYLERNAPMSLVPKAMDGDTCTHIDYRQVQGGCLQELYKAYRCNNCDKLF